MQCAAVTTWRSEMRTPPHIQSMSSSSGTDIKKRCYNPLKQRWDYDFEVIYCIIGMSLMREYYV